MSRPPQKSRSAVRSDSVLGRALAEQRELAGAAPEYLTILDAIATGSDASKHFDRALAGANPGSSDDAARLLLNAVVIAAVTSKIALDLPKRHAETEAAYRRLFAALKTLGSHFNFQDFPPLSVPSNPPGLDGVDVDALLHRAVDVHRIADGSAEPTLQDPEWLWLLARINYRTKEAPNALLAMWEHLSANRNATMDSLSEPGLSRKRVKDADRLAFITRLNESMKNVLGDRNIGFLTAITNILFDAEGKGGFSEDAIRKYLGRRQKRRK